MSDRMTIMAVLAWMLSWSLQVVVGQGANSSKGEVDPNAVKSVAETQRRLKLDQIRAAWDRQRAMFRNARYRTYWKNSENTTRTTHECLVDKDGRYKVIDEFYGKEGITRGTRYGFDGHVYWGYWASSQIGSEANAWIEGERKFYDPTDLFDHIFDRRLQGMFDHPERVKIVQTSEGLWILTYREDRADHVFEVTVDPNLDFVMTNRTHLYDRGSIWDRECQYRRTPEGFWYPCKVRQGASDVISITAFELNVPDANLAVDIPKGTRVVDRRVDPNHPDIYPYGVPRKSFEQIVQGSGRCILGVAANEEGRPVAGVPVKVVYHQVQGGSPWGDLRIGYPRYDSRGLSFDDYDDSQARTDAQGRFAMEVQEDGEYTLLFSPKEYAAVNAYDVPVGTKDLKVTLPEGGTVIGRVFCMKGKTKVPIKGTLRNSVYIQQIDRNSLTYLEDGDRTAMPDAEGRFRFERLSTRMRGDPWKPGLVPRLWFIEYLDASKTIGFEDGNMIANVELVLLPKPSEIPPLMGSPLPGFDGIRIDWLEDQAMDRPLLVCFFDMQYQLSRNTILGLSLKAAAIQEKGVSIVGVQVSGTDPNELDKWLRKIRVDFPVGTIESEDAEVRYAWGVKTLPWLILADKDHVVRAEGFRMDELDNMLLQSAESQK